MVIHPELLIQFNQFDWNFRSGKRWRECRSGASTPLYLTSHVTPPLPGQAQVWISICTPAWERPCRWMVGAAGEEPVAPQKQKNGGAALYSPTRRIRSLLNCARSWPNRIPARFLRTIRQRQANANRSDVRAGARHGGIVRELLQPALTWQKEGSTIRWWLRWPVFMTASGNRN